jgi:HlyD family secretion protein
MKKIVIGVVVVIAIGVAAFLLLTIKRGGPKYTTEKITRGDIETTVTATGTVNAVTTVLVGTQVSGTIKELYADFNSPVKKGQLIAQIDPALFEAQVQQAQANLNNAKANLTKAEASLVDTKRTLGRYTELFKRNLVARSNLDTADTNNATAAASVTAAKTLIDQTAAALSLAEINLHYTKILSPVDGVVISRNVDVGQTVAASFQTPTLFNLAVDLTKMQIDTSVDEADVSSVKVGQEAEFTVDAYPAATYKGTVSQVRNAAITVQNVVTYDVIVQVDNRELTLKPGMTAEVSIITALTKNVLRIPDAALRFKPVETGGPTLKKTGAAPQGLGPAVWILDNNNPRRIPLSIGFSDGTFTQLVSGTLTEGQDVITESLSKPKAQAGSGSGPRMF